MMLPFLSPFLSIVTIAPTTIAQTTIAQTVLPLPPHLSLPPRPAAKPVPPQETLPPQEPVLPQETLPRMEVFRPQEIRPLTGKLDEVPVFNSNSPEILQTEGILLSTFPPEGMQVPAAHQNFAFQGRFDLFSHHITQAKTSAEAHSFFQGILVYNPSTTPVVVEVLQGASYLTRPDALFVDLPAYVDDPLGTVYAGPGSRAMSDVLRGRRQGTWPSSMTIAPGTSQMLMNLPIPAGMVLPGSNGRTTLLRLRSSGPVYVANLAMIAPLNPDNTERTPTPDEWQALLIRSGLAGPRDIPPTPIQDLANYARVVYGRVAGVALGSQWQASLTDTGKAELAIPDRGHAFSYGLSTLYRGTFGTGQVQSAKMLTRYPDTAYLANGNYGIQYNLTLPLHNSTQQRQTVTISLQTPLKDDRNKGGLLFYRPQEERVFFRGPVRLTYSDDRGAMQIRYLHVVQQRGQEGSPLVTLNLGPGDRRNVQIDLLYPPDSTPPQVLTVRTLSETQ